MTAVLRYNDHNMTIRYLKTEAKECFISVKQYYRTKPE